ncbi:hypothetical protein OF846_003780 [Rhodotorula toruloides]|nr:hypothetical protein OF846_003780 [Rhodotorula toruloides]
MSHPTAAPLPTPPAAPSPGDHSARFLEHMFLLKMQQTMAQRALRSSSSGLPLFATEQPHSYVDGSVLPRIQRHIKHGFENLESMVQQTNLRLDALFSLIEDSCMPPLVSMPSNMTGTAHETADDDLPEMPPLVDHEGRLYYLDGRVETSAAPAVVVAELATTSKDVLQSSAPLPTCGNVGCIAVEHSSVLQHAVEQPHEPATAQSNADEDKMDDEVSDAQMDDEVSDAETEGTLPAGSGEDADTETFDEPTPSSLKASGWADDEWEPTNVETERFVYPGTSRRLSDRSRKSSPHNFYSGFRKPDQRSLAGDDACEDGQGEEDPEIRINRIQIALLEAKLKLAKKELEIAQRREAEGGESSMDEAED